MSREVCAEFAPSTNQVVFLGALVTTYHPPPQRQDLLRPIRCAWVRRQNRSPFRKLDNGPDSGLAGITSEGRLLENMHAGCRLHRLCRAPRLPQPGFPNGADRFRNLSKALCRSRGQRREYLPNSHRKAPRLPESEMCLRSPHAIFLLTWGDVLCLWTLIRGPISPCSSQ